MSSKLITKSELQKILRKELLNELVPTLVKAGPPGAAGARQSKTAIIRKNVEAEMDDGVFRRVQQEYTVDLNLRSDPSLWDSFWAGGADVAGDLFNFLFGQGADAIGFFEAIADSLPGSGLAMWMMDLLPGSDAIKTAAAESKNLVFSAQQMAWGANQKKQKLDLVSSATKVQIMGTFNGQVVISQRSFDRLANALTCALMSPLPSSDNLSDAIKIIKFMSGEVNTVKNIMGQLGDAWPGWTQLKRKYADLVNKFNDLVPGEDSVIDPATVMSLGSNPIFVLTEAEEILDGIEALKYEFTQRPVCHQIYEFEKTEIYDDGGFFGFESTRPALKLVVKTAGKTISDRIDFLISKIVATEQSLQILAGQLRQPNVSLNVAGISAFQNLQNELITKINPLKGPLRSLSRQKDTFGILNNPQGSEKVFNAAAFNDPARQDESVLRTRFKFNKKLLLEDPNDWDGDGIPNGLDPDPGIDPNAPTTGGGTSPAGGGTAPAPAPTGNPTTWSDWIQSINDSQSQASQLRAARQTDFLQPNDRLQMWLGPNPNALPSKDAVAGQGSVQNLTREGVANWFWSTLTANAAAVGLTVDTANKQIILPSPDNFAFFLVYTSRPGTTTPGQEGYVNPFDDPDFVTALQSIADQDYPKFEFFIGDPIPISAPTPETEEEKEEEKKEKPKCPTDKIDANYGKNSKERIEIVEDLINKYTRHYSLGRTVLADQEWEAETSSAWERVAKHALSKVEDGGLGHEGFLPLELSNREIDNIGDDWENGAKILRMKGYVNSKKEGDLTGMIAFMIDAYNCDPDLTQGNSKIPRKGGSGRPGKRRSPAVSGAPVGVGDLKCADGTPMKKSTWKDIKVRITGPIEDFAPEALQKLRDSMAKLTVELIVNPSHGLGEGKVDRQHTGEFNIGVGGGIKKKTSHDWNVPDSYNPIIYATMKRHVKAAKKKDKKLAGNIFNKIFGKRVAGSVISIIVPCGDYSAMANVKESKKKSDEKILVETIRQLIRESYES